MTLNEIKMCADTDDEPKLFISLDDLEDYILFNGSFCQEDIKSLRSLPYEENKAYQRGFWHGLEVAAYEEDEDETY